MFLFYLDESGHTGNNLSDPDQPITWMVALAIDSQAVPATEAALRSIAKKQFYKRADKPDFEFKGQRIFQGEGDFANLKPPERIQLYNEILSTLSSNGIRIFARGIHKLRHKRRADAGGYYLPSNPYLLAFMYLTESLDGWLERQQPPKGVAATPVLGLVVADEQLEMGREIVARFNRWRQNGTDFGIYAREIKYLIDTVHYVPSHDSWLLQLTDCVAYLRNRLQRAYEAKGADKSKYTKSDLAVEVQWKAYCQGCVEVVRVWP